mgnify:CR=1 FL=1
MYAKRIIPCLDVKNGRVVKGVSFVNIRDAGDPVEAAIEYDRNGADELVFYDITASAEGRALFTDVLREVASSIFIPLTVGGGIGQSRMCMFFLRKAHIGEVQCSSWPRETYRICAENGIPLL